MPYQPPPALQFASPQMQPNQAMQLGLQAINMARQPPGQQPSGQGQGQAGLLQRFFNPSAPLNMASAQLGPGLPAPAMQQPGMLARLFPQLGAQSPLGGLQQPPGALGASVAPLAPPVPPNPLGGF